MIKRVAEFFFRDFAWKLLSLIAALMLWVIGINMTNPMQNHTVRQRVQLNNFEILANEEILLLNEAEVRDTLIQVGVRAQRNEIDLLRTAEFADSVLFNEMINISIDFRAIPAEYVHEANEAVTFRLDVSPNLYHGFEHFSIRPSYVEVQLDSIASSTFAVDVVRHGDVGADSWLHSIRLASNFVTVTGPRTIIREIEKVQAVVDISGLQDDAEQYVELRAFDSYGYDVTENVSLSITSTAAYIDVWPVRQLPINVEFTGEVADGYAVYGFTVEPEFVSVASSSFEGIYEFTVHADLMYASENTLKTINLAEYLPQDMALVHYDRPNVSVLINVEPLDTRIIHVPGGNLRVAGVQAIYQKLSVITSYSITVRGPRSLMLELTAADISIDINLAGLPVGEHSVTVSVTVPDGIEVLSPPPVILIQIDTPAVDEYLPSDEEEEVDEDEDD